MKTRRPPCLEWRDRLALRYEDLAPEDQQALDVHVQTCAICAAALADYHFFEARLEALPPPAIKPLPRLSPHFFEKAIQRPAMAQKRSQGSRSPSAPMTGRPLRRFHKTVATLWSIAAVLCLLLAAGALFRLVPTSRQAAQHLGKNTVLNLNQHTGAVNAVGWSPDGQKVATGSGDGTIKIWNASSGSLLCTYSEGKAVSALSWSPNSQEVAAGGNNKTVETFNAANCSSVKTYTGQSGQIESVAWSPDGLYLASASFDHTAFVWDVSTGDQVFRVPLNEVGSAISWAPVKDEVAIGSWDGVLQIWDIQTEKQLYSTSYTGNPVNAVAWSPNGQSIAVGLSNNTVQVITTASWSWLCTYTEHTNAINAVAWSPDSKYIASASGDETVRVWNPFAAHTPTLMVYTQHTDQVISVAWAPDSKEIISGSADQTAKIWIVTI